MHAAPPNFGDEGMARPEHCIPRSLSEIWRATQDQATALRGHVLQAPILVFATITPVHAAHHVRGGRQTAFQT